MHHPQLTPEGHLKHLLTIEGLPSHILFQILDHAVEFEAVAHQEIKKTHHLKGKSVFNLFFEPSTRTRTTFEIAAKRLSADVINLNVGASSQSKGDGYGVEDLWQNYDIGVLSVALRLPNPAQDQPKDVVETSHV